MQPNGRPEQNSKPSPNRAKQLSAAEVAEAAKRYKDGELLREIAKDLGVHRVTLGSRLTQAGFQIRKKGMNDQAVDEAVRRYEAGESLAQIGIALGYSARKIRSYLLERGVAMRDTHGNLKA